MGHRSVHRWRQARLFPQEIPPVVEFPPEIVRQAVDALAGLLLGALTELTGNVGEARDDAEAES